MKTIIIYTTKSGASKECAEALGSCLPGTTICDAAGTLPDLLSFDTIILGSGVRMGKIYNPMRQLIKNNLKLLQRKKVSIYLCNAYPEGLDKVVAQNIPDQLIDSATQIVTLGGKPPFRKTTLDEWLNRSAFQGFVELCQTQKI